MTDLNEISRALQMGKAKQVKLLVQQAIDEGLDAQTILEQGLLSGMAVIGENSKPTRYSCRRYWWRRAR